MKGPWTAEEIEKQATRRRSAEENHLLAIMRILEKSRDGLSNAEIDALLDNNSQWAAALYLKQLSAALLIVYRTQFFGEPGKYILTESGRALLRRVSGDHLG